MKLSAAEITLAVDCLRKTAETHIYDDREFQTLMGVDRDEMRQAATLMGQGNVTESGWIALNTLTNLLGYPHSESDRDAFVRALGVDCTTLRSLQSKLSSVPLPSDFL